MRIHEEASEFKDKIVRLKSRLQHPQFDIDGAEFSVEDWWDRLTGGSWLDTVGNPACLIYAIRAATCGLPKDDEVVYGKYMSMGILIHVSEIEGEVE